MKKLIKLSIVVALSIFANFAIAQKSPEEKTKIIVTKLTKKLTLSN
jgi:tripartite-type tricarboxylate transporter receptor subunit TctC